jgi:hypothetical protein
MRLIAVYDTITKTYIDKQVAELTNLGYSVTAIDISEASEKYAIKYAPSFAILKNEKIGYTLGGKQNFTRVLQWVQDSGI